MGSDGKDGVSQLLSSTIEGFQHGDFDRGVRGIIFNGLGLNKWNDAITSNMNNVSGEITGDNLHRQQEWQKNVKQDAQNAQDKAFADSLASRQNADLEASRGANRRGGSRGAGTDLNWEDPTGDKTDFLGV